MENDRYVLDCGGEWILEFDPKPHYERVIPEMLHAIMTQMERGTYVIRTNAKHEVKKDVTYTFEVFGIEYTILRERR
ncbi:hypothetical protein [Tumebacillus permanentifrigoris]|uniref:Uncharacterized protein n=1 Tax=Tumebacillus permanentifrigoris TaxID=378543 RepID=A0A316D3A6_9BACL|nr:hypothetical protein [Tumebacillus permanentifrigoris]PWK05320.1 hypothetical protein C7459_12469 [Tumebacillus permanentifrigoris]